MTAANGRKAFEDHCDAKAASREAERAIVAALLLNPDGREIIRLGITEDLFAGHETREAFQAIRKLILDGIQPDIVLLSAALSTAATIEIESAWNEHVSAANLPYWVDLLKGYRRERLVQAARQRLAKAAAAGAPDHELQAILESIRQAAQDETKPARFVWAQDFCQNTALQDDLIDGYLPAASVGVIFGDSEAYKSFLLIDIAGHIAIGKPWRGHEVQQGKVMFIAGEGGNGLRVRIAAWFAAMGEPIRDFAVSTVPLELCDPKNVDLLLASIQEFAGGEHFSLIVLDTLNTHFGDGDENATADMTRFRNGALRLSQSTGATVAISHHCGLADKGRGRGSISLKNGIDWEFKLERSGDNFTTLSSTKVKDGPKPAPLSWQLEQQPLPWADKHGRPINGAVLTPVDHVLTIRTSARLSRPQRIALDALVNIIPSGEDHALIGDWRSAALAAGITQSESKQGKYAAFSRAVEGLVDAGQVKVDGPRCYPVNKQSTNGQHVDSVDPGNAAVNESTKSTHSYRSVDFVDRDQQPQQTKPSDDKPLSPIAKTVMAAMTKEGIAPDDLERMVARTHPKAGEGLIRAEVNSLLLSGKINRINGRLVVGGESSP